MSASDADQAAGSSNEEEPGTILAQTPYELSVKIMNAVLSTGITLENRHLCIRTRHFPFEHSKRRCDMVIKYVEQYGGQWQNLCFMEILSLPAISDSGLANIEQQALRWCQEFIANQDVEISYAATIASDRIRFWKHLRGSNGLQPMWGAATIADWDEYKEVGDENNVKQIALVIMEMMRHPPTAVHPPAVAAFAENFYGDSRLP